MGLLRTILAIAVVVYHSFKIFGLRMCGGQVAVESFYIISGFYMALILNEKYSGISNYKKFILSRFYRIFPVYWFILLVALLTSIIGYSFFNSPYYLANYISHNQCLPSSTWLYFILENIIIIGQDVFYFLRLDDLCQLHFTYSAPAYKHTAYQYLLVPQAWSISIEFLFYLVAPFLVTKKASWQIILVITGLTIRFIYAKFLYLDFDPWTYRFFPFELPFFLAGSIAYKIYTKKNFIAVSNFVGYMLLILCLSIIILFNEIPLHQQLKTSLFYLVLCGSLPFIFSAFKNNRVDRHIGELSFSIYISHHIIVSLLRGYFFAHIHLIPYYGYTTLICSLIVAWILQITLIKRVEIYRIKRFS